MNKEIISSQPSPEVTINKEKIHKEEERKFLVDPTVIPYDLDSLEKIKIVQGYLTIIPDEYEERVRQQTHENGTVEYFFTTKTGKGETRIEEEYSITKEKFDELWNQRTIPGVIEKTRHLIPYNDYLIELDVFEKDHSGLIMAEVEFKTKLLKENFTVPSWFGREVTHDKKYKNQALVLYGLPLPDIQSRAPRFQLEKGLETSINQIQHLLENSTDQPVIIAVAGGSASGKTSQVACKIDQKFLQNSLLISIDDYYKGAAYIEKQAKQGVILNWDQPEAVDIDLLKEHLSLLKSNQSIQKPIYSFKTGERTGYETIFPKKLIIIEGLFALNDTLKDQADHKIFVDIGSHGRIIRRLLRDIDRTSQKPADILKYFAEIVEPMHEKHIQSNISNADIIIENEYDPVKEAQRSNVNENQIKFRQHVSKEIIRKSELICHTNQVDHFYTPFGQDLKDSDEILRIRQENGFYILTYKGPKNKDSAFRERYKLEFEIDEKTKNAFTAFYGTETKIIHKERTIYSYQGTIFSIDKVFKEENQKKEFLGDFTEIRLGSSKDIAQIATQIGFDPNLCLKESYFEL